ncbi:BTAD domain-containing putative transcriptional regulator [Amycolatopsis jiangsuensis]|uniref:DNA-binding NarL/FixJ family response regulator/DNA-binding SARP family transcriptional activator n=1 Tax=Amycolatopsis jiangsuensis TaxID=1181879 RepID=A0A840J2S7_9PSEU|nr:BTAD domain-containing putative transcriptional regulator [Amycolatopsis jiangsuensis]MBB4688360.1 DNA-binding NarL/FixJ family response regulator/DNA-binding SARP family transcriptional activator [Amycolatopsis jiangsuensis]
MTAVRVLLVDDQELVRSGLRRILRARDGFEVAGECCDGSGVPEALAAAGTVDVVVMDLRMKQVDGIEATRRLRADGPRPPVLALTTFDDDELLAGVLRAGANGYVLKDSPAEDLIRAVRAVAAGEAWLDPAVTGRVLTTYRATAGDRPPPGLLTARETELLALVGRGLTDAETAHALGIPEATVDGELRRVGVKLRLRDRAAAIVYAFDHGLVTPGRGASVAEPADVEWADPGLRFSVLGPLRAWRGDRILDLGPVRQQALLAALLLRPGVPVRAGELLDDVWGLEPPGTGGRVVPVYVHRLRKCLRAGGERTEDSVIASDRGAYRFDGARIRLDSTDFETRAAETEQAVRAGDLPAAVAAADAALALFQGEPLAGLPGPFAEGERMRLTERRLALLQDKASAQVRLGRVDDVVAELSAFLAVHPHREPLAALLMRALRAAGRRADALAVYHRVRDRLRSDLDVEPGPALDRELRVTLSSSQAH